jgi:hypothetical protein
VAEPHRRSGGIDTERREAQPLPLEVAEPEQPGADLQALVHQWHTQASINALKQESEAVLLQLVRFTGQHKHMQKIALGTRVMLPIFQGDDLAVSWKPYKIQSAVSHLGAAPSQGHYRALLRQGDRWWQTEDGMLAEPLGAEGEARGEVYLIWVSRAPAL